MTDPVLLEALERAIATTGVEHYRFLCLSHPDPQIRADYQRLVVEIATGQHDSQRHEPSTEPAGPCSACPGSGYP
jgi:hypothetical protein